MSAGGADTAVSLLGMTGLPFVNVFNGCATGGASLTTAHSLLASGGADYALVVGFDQHPPGAFDLQPEDWGLGAWYGEAGLMVAPQFFAMKIRRYMDEHGITDKSLAQVAAKAFRNGALNPNAWRRKPITEEEILGSAMVTPPLRQFMFCSPGDGAAALVLGPPEAPPPAARSPSTSARSPSAPAGSGRSMPSARRSRSRPPPR